MASPPPHSFSPTALSPPYSGPPGPSLNKKRSATADHGAAAPALKRRKASNLSAASAPSAHPLRQTAFPDGRGDLRRSPSVDTASVVSGSQVSGTGKKRRGRKTKAADGGGSKEQTPSLVGGRAATVASGAGGDKDQGAGEEEDDGEGMHMGLVDGMARTQEQKQEENRLRAMLVEAFDPEQYDRYERWRASRLSDAVVKRVVNATVSQSVPQNVVLAVKSVAKLFIGELLEGARRVQGQWIEATGEKQSDLPTPPPSTADAMDEGEAAPRREERRGPLRPDHLREALRRYRVSGEGGGVGMQGLWHVQQSSGLERFAPRNGRRTFR